MNTRIKRISAFNYFGGKNRHLDWQLPLLPSVHSYTHYVETCCGSAAILLNKQPSPIETINDLNGRVVNFFRVLRERPADLIALLQLTPYHRGEFMDCNEISLDPLEDARRFFVRVMQSFGGGGDGNTRRTSWRTGFRESRKGVSLEVSRWLTKIEGLEEVAQRLLTCQIDNRPAVDIIKKYDTATTFFYVDPPYVFETRSGNKDYRHEMSQEDHLELARSLNQVKAKVMICSYDCDFMNENYPPQKWQKVLGPTRHTNLNNGKGGTKFKREHVWLNYTPLSHSGNLFNQ